MQQNKTIGIEALTVNVPEYTLDLKTLAEANNVDPEKYTIGLGALRQAVAHPMEDAVTLAVDAAQTLFKNYNINSNDVGLLIVGSETGVDSSKPIASFVHGLLGLSSHCRTFDTVHACYSATAALQMAIDWCRGSGKGKKALVIASDIARYEIGSPGEPTQGAGAVAMLISDKPDIFTFDEHTPAAYTRDIFDFWRPNYQHTAIVDGKVSIENYLELLEETYKVYAANSGYALEDYSFLLFHVPFPKMAYKGYKRLMATFNDGNESKYEQQTDKAIWANRELGNIYSGSLFLALAGLIERYPEEAKGKRIGLFSYGSGSCGEFFSGTISNNTMAWQGNIALEEGLEKRKYLSYADYLTFRELTDALRFNNSYKNMATIEKPSKSQVTFHGIQNHQRRYEKRAVRIIQSSPSKSTNNAESNGQGRMVAASSTDYAKINSPIGMQQAGGILK